MTKLQCYEQILKGNNKMLTSIAKLAEAVKHCSESLKENISDPFKEYLKKHEEVKNEKN